jgi:parvulin-like peptidyl-prolyl isomerase
MDRPSPPWRWKNVRRAIPLSLTPLLLAIGFLTFGAGFLPHALQGQDRTLVDRIAAVVGDSVISLSQIEERIFQLQARGVEIPPDAEARALLRRDILDQIIGEQLILQAAIKDTTIVVDEQELEEFVSAEMQERSSAFGGQAVFQRGLADQGWTLATYREFLRGQFRQQQLYQQFMAVRAREVGSVVVEESEIREFFEEQKDAIGQRPPGVVFAQVIVVPTPSDSTKAEARAEAEGIREMAVAGDDFAELARRFSRDPGSKDSGGDLGWFRRGDMTPTFEDAAFRLAPSEISAPVESPFGYHVIKLNRRRSGEVRASHILIPVEPTPADVDQAARDAEEVRRRLDAGEPPGALRERFGDLEAPDTLRVAFDRLRELPPGFAEPLLQAEPGQILGPIRYLAREQPRFGVLKVVDIVEGGPYTLEDEDLRERIRGEIRQQKMVERILDELRSKTYVQIVM